VREFPFTAKDGRSGVVRVSRSADARAANRIVEMTMNERPRTLIVDPQEFWAPRDWRRNRLDWGAAGVWLTADLDGEVAGTLSANRGERFNTRHTAELGITVAPEVRGLGVGRALMEALEVWAKEFGVTKLTLRVFSGNARARALYEQMGYEVEGVQRRQVRFPDGTEVDTVLMAKFLG
jgi:RimJ/RimL family protein N-acetyltransferase